MSRSRASTRSRGASSSQSLMEIVAEHEVSVVLSSHRGRRPRARLRLPRLLAASRVQFAGEIEDLLATHRRLSGPRRDPATLPRSQAGHPGEPHRPPEHAARPHRRADPRPCLDRRGAQPRRSGARLHGPGRRQRGVGRASGGSAMIWLDLAAVPRPGRGGGGLPGGRRGGPGHHRLAPARSLRHERRSPPATRTDRPRSRSIAVDCATSTPASPPTTSSCEPARPAPARGPGPHRDLLGRAARRPRARERHLQARLDAERHPHPLAGDQDRAGRAREHRRRRSCSA